ncbi:hypothetical protein ACO22_00709 [Paracoccidioides brasiliensis]|uniref:Uncharacterized protein n=1 Tax=Paracoccidioides brasiliensis TaxID=121759 RepID=A0A1D2JNL6_PARBR|nr:hypothetical protein ACO22_00709 [Paracoccidioides brasiliensis]
MLSDLQGSNLRTQHVRITLKAVHARSVSNGGPLTRIWTWWTVVDAAEEKAMLKLPATKNHASACFFKTYRAVHPKSTKANFTPARKIILILHQRNQAMRLNQLLALSSFLIPALAIGRECCCDRYSQFALENEAKIVAQCKTTWSAVKNGASGEDYCNSVFCIQQQSWIKPWLAGKCTLAGYQCGDCANGNVGCLG